VSIAVIPGETSNVTDSIARSVSAWVERPL
jgi:hypothetical protein